MSYKIVISPEAVTDYKRIPIEERQIFRKFVNHRLSITPELMDDLTISGLTDIYGVKFNLGTGNVSLYYDLTGSVVEILAILVTDIYSEDGLVITQKGGPVAVIPKFDIRKVTAAELKNKIDLSKFSIKSGKWMAFDELAL